MILNRWNEKEANSYKTPLEKRVYTSKLLGEESLLVLHGGGNTSVKDEYINLFGEVERVLYVKGSGKNLNAIESTDFPGLRLSPLLRLRTLDELSDSDIVNELRIHLIRVPSPDPSVEALLHAFIPFTFVDHTHSDSILTLTNQAKGEEIIRTLFGARVGIVPYVKPGFKLAKLSVQVFEKDPSVTGLIVMKHGVFTFGDTAKESYDRMIELVQIAERFIGSKKRSVRDSMTKHLRPEKREWMQSLRREFLVRNFPCVLLLNDSEKALEFVSHPKLNELALRGLMTPDHVLRTKRIPLVIGSDCDRSEIRHQCKVGFDQFEGSYRDYFERHSKGNETNLSALDPLPRIILVPGIGIVSAGKTFRDCQIAIDIYSHTADVILDAEDIGQYEALGEKDVFDVEYWTLEQDKLRLNPQILPLSSKIAVVTGGVSGIGRSITEEFLKQGASVFVLDLNSSQFESARQSLLPVLNHGNFVKFLETDVTNREMVKNIFDEIIKLNGGIDIAVLNAGIFPSSSLLENISDSEWKKCLDVNLNGSWHVVSEVLRCLKEQENGGDILFIASKNVHAPGPQAGAYSVSKSAQTQLARICALESGPHGVRVNTLHPHLIFDTGIWSEEIIRKRAASYGLTPEQYKRNNLLKTELSSLDVARAAFSLVNGSFSKTTGAQIPVDGGSDRTL